jgi:hypothetical protein
LLELVELPVLFVDDSETVVLILVELLPFRDPVAVVVAVGADLDVVEVLEEVLLEEVVLKEVVLKEVVLREVVLEDVVLEDVVVVIVEDWTTTLLEEGGSTLLEVLELTEVEEEPTSPELPAWPLHEPEVLILCQLPLSSPYIYSLPQP